ncbi:MAG: DUF922 domain-containing protein [Pseudomonadota bacterium]
MVKTMVKLNAPVEKSFEVKGSTGEELFAALKKHGNAGVFRGYPHMEVAPSEDKIEAVKIGCDPTITLPEWKGAAKAEPKLKKGWQKTVDLARKHEMAHFRDFKARMKTLIKEISKAETLDRAAIDKLILDMRLQGLKDRNDLHERRLDKDWSKIEKFLKGK